LEYTTWICVFLPLFIILLTMDNKKKLKKQHILKILGRYKKKGDINMNEIIKKFIGKTCIITTMNETITGKVETVEDNWIAISNDKKDTGLSELIKIDYISRIREYPTNKNGKKKLIVT